jgi:hypothetical protein
MYLERSGITHAITRTGEKGKRHCLPNASIMIHRELTFPITALSPIETFVVVPSQNRRGAHPDRLLILPFTRRKFYASVSSSRQSTNGIAVRPESRRNRVCTALVRASVFGWMACLTYTFYLLPGPTETALERDYFMTGSSLPWSSRRPTQPLTHSPRSSGIWDCRWYTRKETKVRRRKFLIQRVASLNNRDIVQNMAKNQSLKCALQIRSGSVLHAIVPNDRTSHLSVLQQQMAL